MAFQDTWSEVKNTMNRVMIIKDIRINTNTCLWGVVKFKLYNLSRLNLKLK